MALQHTVKDTMHKGKKYYVAECVEIAVVTRGSTLDETLGCLQEAVALHLEGEDLSSFGLAPAPTMVVTTSGRLAESDAYDA